MLQVRRTLDEGVREDISYEDAQESKKLRTSKTTLCVIRESFIVLSIANHKINKGSLNISLHLKSIPAKLDPLPALLLKPK